MTHIDDNDRSTVDRIITWADGVQGALGTEFAGRVTEMEAAVSSAVLEAAREAPMEAARARAREEEVARENERVIKAEEVYENYDFHGSGVRSVDTESGWDLSDLDDLTRVVFVEYEEPDADGETSGHLSFHVRFDSDGEVAEGYALDTDSGNLVGTPWVPAKAPAP